MAEYEVVKEYQLPPHADWESPQFAGEDGEGYVLQPGEVIYDGQIEPDIVADLTYRKVIMRTDGTPFEADAEADDDDKYEKHPDKYKLGEE